MAGLFFQNNNEYNLVDGGSSKSSYDLISTSMHNAANHSRRIKPTNQLLFLRGNNVNCMHRISVSV